MIDTVVLMMENTQFHIELPQLFSPSAEAVLRQPSSIRFGKDKVLKHRNNPTPAQRAQSYWPRLTLNVSPAKGGGLQYRLRVEFACPKVLFGNNFDELVDIQFGDLVRSLAEKMGVMGVRVTPEDLSQSLVSAVHYSKNVRLADFTRCTMVLQELAKLNVWKRLDVNSKDFRNHGHVLKWHANSFEICVYDKVADLQQARISPKRAFEGEPEGQLNLFNDLHKQQTQVLRLEVRLNTRRKIESTLKKLNENEPPTFCELFSKRIAKKVLQHFWAELMAEHSMASVLETDIEQPEHFAEAIMAEHPAISPAKLTSIIGTTRLLQQVGEKGLAVLFGQKSAKTIKRMITECKKYQPNATPRWVAIRQVKTALDNFYPLRLKECYNQKGVTA